MSTPANPLGAAQAIMDPINDAYNRVRDVFKNVPGKDAPPQNTDWHDQAVKDASDSFKTAPNGKTPVIRKALRKAIKR